MRKRLPLLRLVRVCAICFSPWSALLWSAPAAADFTVCNLTNSTIGVAVGYDDNGVWVTEGWWTLSPPRGDEPSCVTPEALAGPHGPGEYEIANFYILGMGTPYTPSSPNAAPHDEAAQRQIYTVFTMRAEGLRVCHAGAFVPTLTPRQLDELNNIEVLVVDAGGDSARRVARLVSQLGPRIVVPVGWQAAADDRDDISALQPLLAELGITDAPTQSTLRVTPTSLPRELSVVPLRRTT